MSIKLKLEGFEELLKDIEKAGGEINKAVESTMRQSAATMQTELKAQMQNAGVDGHLIGAMPPFTVETEGNRTTARVGYKKGAYNPDNPSDGYKVVFLNYGTPNRSKHGKVVARGFVKKAKTKAGRTIKKQQEQTLKKILSRLEK